MVRITRHLHRNPAWPLDGRDGITVDGYEIRPRSSWGADCRRGGAAIGTGLGGTTLGKRCHLERWPYLAIRCVFQSATRAGRVLIWTVMSNEEIDSVSCSKLGKAGVLRGTRVYAR